MNGIKHDNGKIRMDLLPFEALEAVAEVLTRGTRKYSDNGWQTVENGERRYLAALLRHLAARERGEMTDPESGLLHAAHLAADALFILWFEIQKEKQGVRNEKMFKKIGV